MPFQIEIEAMTTTQNQPMNTYNEHKDVLAIDISGVLLPKASFNAQDYLVTLPFPNAFESILKLTEWFDDIYLVSKSADINIERIDKWLKQHDFYAKSGVFQTNVVFCETVTEKDELCKLLGVTHLIDDSIENLNKAHSVKYRYLFENLGKHIALHAHETRLITVSDSWLNVYEQILNSFTESAKTSEIK